MATKEEIDAVRGLVKPTMGGSEQEPLDLPSDPTDYEDNDEAEPLPEGGVYLADGSPQGVEGEVEEAEPEKDAAYWQQQAVLAQAEAAELRRSREEEKEQAFQRHLESLPDDERAKAEAVYWKEKVQAGNLERAQDRLATAAPIAATSWNLFSRVLGTEIEDPIAFEKAIMTLEPEFDRYIEAIVKQRVEASQSQSQQDLNRAWGVPGGLHKAQPKSQAIDPALRSYKQAQANLKGATPDVDSVRALLDARRRLTQSR